MEWIPKAGACLATRKVMSREARVRWMVRESPKHPADNGWRIMSLADTTEDLGRADTWQIVDFNDVCTIEPMLVGIWDLPVGADLQIVDDGRMRIVDTPTGREVPMEQWYVPPAMRAPGSGPRP